MSIARHALLIGTDVHPLVGDDAVAAAVELIRELGDEEVVEGGRLIALNEAGEEVGDLTEQLAYTLSHSSKRYDY
ncbi:hypothetical protein [Variovorax sp. LjRoot178]|uniref:hypothetical protein n=1 Tax=Variovorax sp. LjRoot178 TaxID=3342277 RepID=UPI003ECD9D60